MNTLQLFLAEHPYGSIVIAIVIAIVARILLRDLAFAHKFIDEVNATKSTTISHGWSGVERRGPNRAKNVLRPAFGKSVIFSEEVEVLTKTGTHN